MDTEIYYINTERYNNVDTERYNIDNGKYTIDGE